MTSRLLIALAIATTVAALGAEGSASAANTSLDGPITTGTWDTTYTYGVNGTKRTCTLTRGAKCV